MDKTASTLAWIKTMAQTCATCCAQLLSHVWCFAAPGTIACQAPLSMGFSRQEHWSELPCPPPVDLPNPGIEPASLMSPALADGCFTTSTTWEAQHKPVLAIIEYFIITHSHFFKSQLYSRMAVIKQKKIVNFLKSQLLSSDLYNVPCDRTGRMHKALVLTSKADVCLKEKHLCSLRCEPERPLFSQNISFTWKNYWQTKYGYSDLGTWQTFSQKWAEWACHIKENNSQCLSPKIKFELSRKT